MELYCGMELPDYILDCIRDSNEVLREDLRLWNRTTEEIVEHIKKEVLESYIYLAYQDDICLLFMDKTPYTIQMSILYGKTAKTNKLVRIIKELFTIFEEKADVHKIETANTCPDLYPILTKCGFSLEGTFVDSRRLPTGEFVDEWSYGYLVDV